ADDLKRFLGKRPVLARRPTLAERARHWMRRNPELTAASTIVLLVTVAALGVSTFLINRERGKTRIERDQVKTQREVARASRREAVQAVKWYAEFGLEWIAEQPQLQGKDREFALALLAFFEKLAQIPDDDPQFQLERALAYRKAGDIHLKLGEPALGTKAYSKAAKLLEKLRIENPDVSQ